MASEKIYTFDANKIISSLPDFAQKEITELTVNDPEFSRDKKQICNLLQAVSEQCPELFVSLLADVNVIDSKLCNLLKNVYCSLEINLTGLEKNGNLLFDKKLYQNKINMLNASQVVFGFNMDYGVKAGDTFKSFKDRLDFAVSLYPNHIDFAQLFDKEKKCIKSTGIYSSKDIETSRNIAFAVWTFYSCGRAVPFFNSLLKPLKISANAFFSDFSEWQICSNCGVDSGFDPEVVSHQEVEKLMIKFLEQKFEEKQKSHLIPLVKDVVKLNGAFARVSETGLEEIVETVYSPDDLLSPQIFDLQKFFDNIPLESNSTKVFVSDECVDYRIM